MAAFDMPFPYYECSELILEDDKTDVKLQLKIEHKTEVKLELEEEHIEIKEENYGSYSIEDEQSSNTEGKVLSQNINPTKFNVNIAEDLKKSDVGKCHKEHKCPLCDFVTKGANKLTHHTVKVHNTGGYECANCDFRTHSKPNLINHLKSKTACQIRLARLKKLDGIDIPQEFCTKEENGFKCIYCEYFCLQRYMLRRHVYKVHLKLKTNSCLHCDFKTSYKMTLDSHMLLKHPEKCDLLQLKLQSCLYCEFKTLYMESHMTRKHPEKCDPSQLKIHFCLHCDFKSSYKRTFKSHMILKHPEKCDSSLLETHSCLHCEFKTLYKDTFQWHMARNHSEKLDQSQMKLHSCLHCEFKAPSKKIYASHMVRQHPKKCDSSVLNIYSCLQCEFKAPSKRIYQSHMVREHPEKCDPSVLKIHSCLYCDFKTLNKKTFRSHMLIKHPEKCDKLQLEKEVCQLCGKVYLTNYSLQRHIQIEHLNEKKKCGLCDYSCVRTKDLVFHMKRFHKFRCHDCNFTSPRKFILKEHILRNHLKVEEYTCDMCSFKTLRRMTLDVHKRAHNCPERLECKYCPFITLNSKTLQDHNKVQHNKGFLQCDQCDYKTIKKNLLVNHVNCKHNKMEYICQICRKCKYSYPGGLLCHMYKAHGKQPIKTRKKLCLKSPNLDIDSGEVEKNEYQRTKKLNTNDYKEQIKQEIKTETL